MLTNGEENFAVKFIEMAQAKTAWDITLIFPAQVTKKLVGNWKQRRFRGLYNLVKIVLADNKFSRCGQVDDRAVMQQMKSDHLGAVTVVVEGAGCKRGWGVESGGKEVQPGRMTRRTKWMMTLRNLNQLGTSLLRR